MGDREVHLGLLRTSREDVTQCRAGIAQRYFPVLSLGVVDGCFFQVILAQTGKPVAGLLTVELADEGERDSSVMKDLVDGASDLGLRANRLCAELLVGCAVLVKSECQTQLVIYPIVDKLVLSTPWAILPVV